MILINRQPTGIKPEKTVLGKTYRYRTLVFVGFGRYQLWRFIDQTTNADDDFWGKFRNIGKDKSGKRCFSHTVCG